MTLLFQSLGLLLNTHLAYAFPSKDMPALPYRARSRAAVATIVTSEPRNSRERIPIQRHDTSLRQIGPSRASATVQRSGLLIAGSNRESSGLPGRAR
jgi:hypothetical protein